jgi:hypothetical protein
MCLRVLYGDNFTFLKRTAHTESTLMCGGLFTDIGTQNSKVLIMMMIMIMIMMIMMIIIIIIIIITSRSTTTALVGCGFLKCLKCYL